MLNQKLNQSLERPIIANKIDSGCAWVRANALLGPLLLDGRVSALVSEFRQSDASRRIESCPRALVVLPQARKSPKDGDSKIARNRCLRKYQVISIFGLQCLKVIMR
jgi:hypothetical protein